MKYLLTIALSLTAIAAPIDREDSGRRIAKGCETIVKEDHKNFAAICECARRNYLANLDDRELALITRSHEDDATAEEEMQKPENDDLVIKDHEISETCLENSDFIYKP